MERDNVFSLQDYLAVLRRQRGLIALIAVFAAVGGAVWFLLQTPMYEARAELALERVRAAQDVSLNELLNPSGNVRDTDVSGATSPSVAQSAAELLGRDDPSQLRTQVRAESVSEDRILRITATDADPVTAAQIADAFATAFIEYRRQEAVDTVLLTQGELDQRASEIREEISEVDAQIAALDIPPPAVEEGATADGEADEGDGASAEAQPDGEGQAADEGEAADESASAEDGQAAESARPAPTPEELDQLETLQIRRNALRTQLSQVIARSTELGESADALTGFAADFTPASVPTSPIGNTIVEVVGVAFILGLALGIGLAFVRDHFDDVIRDEDDFKRASEGRPVLGRIPIWKPRDHDNERVVSVVDPTSSAAEAYRELSAGVRFLLVARADEPEHDAAEHHGLSRSRVVMISSASIGEGKTETAANLAVAAARVGLRTVLVDADLRRPAVAKRFGLGRSTGLSDALLNGEPAESHMVDVGVEDLFVLPAGTIPPNPAELLASPAMRAMQQGLLRKYDLVVIDTPAVLAVPDALEIGPYVDLAVMVGRVGHTGRRRLGAAVERLEQVGSAVSGTVLNGLDRATDGYYYAYAYEETTGRKGRRQTRRERKEAEARAKADAKADAKQAKVDAKADAKQAKVDAKQAKADARAAKRSGKRQGRRGGDRRGADEQVEQTLRAAGGAGAANAVALRESGPPAERERPAERARSAEPSASAAVAPTAAAEPETDAADAAPPGGADAVDTELGADEAALPADAEPDAAGLQADNEAEDAADVDRREGDSEPGTVTAELTDGTAADVAQPKADAAHAADPGGPDAVNTELGTHAAALQADTESKVVDAEPEADPEPETIDVEVGTEPAASSTAPEAVHAEPDAARPDTAAAAALDGADRSDPETVDLSSTGGVAEPARAALQVEPATEAAAEPEQPAIPSGDDQTPATEVAAAEPEQPAAPARRRSRRRTRIPAAKPGATRRRSAQRTEQSEPAEAADTEVPVSARPVARTATRTSEDDDNLLFGDRPDTST